MSDSTSDKQSLPTPRTDDFGDTSCVLSTAQDMHKAWWKFCCTFERELAESDAATVRWWRAASPYSTPEALKEALSAQSATGRNTREGWRAAITLAHNLLAQYSDRHNDNDETDEATTLSEAAERLRPYLDISDEELAGMVAEANPPIASSDSGTNNG